MPRVSEAVGDRLARLICDGVAQMCGVRVESRTSRNWASITFSGERHALRLRLEGEQAGAAADALAAELPEREFALNGHLLADIAVVGDRREQGGGLVLLDLEALTVEAS